MGVQAALLADQRRLHLQHGPIDLVIEATGSPAEVRRAYVQAHDCFQTVLGGLAAQLPVLRQPARADLAVDGPVARAMLDAVLPFARAGLFVTPMAAVAGAVADHVLAAMVAGRDLARAYVNNGGDIALFLTPGQVFRVGTVGGSDGAVLDGVTEIGHAMPVRGLATSGAGGRSFSLGVADAVTVLAATAAQADAAATLVANAVDLPHHPHIHRCRAQDLAPDSDLGDLPVTVAVGDLTAAECRQALRAGVARAEGFVAQGRIFAAKLGLKGLIETVNGASSLPGAVASEIG